jgi:hypothetical protein
MAKHTVKAGGTPLGMAQAFSAEFDVLRPGSRYADAADTAALFAKVHGESKPLSALCISGGGIRSATFALGAIQGLAKHRLLDQFDYLSTVSGGGYIGSWLTAWSNRAGGLANVIPRLDGDAKPSDPGTADPIGHLRDYNNYLSPKLGVLSADTWTLIATVLRNLLLNWLVLIPLLMAALLVPRLYLSFLSFPEHLYGAAVFAGGALPNYAAAELDVISALPAVRYGLPLLSALLLALALFNSLRYLPGLGNEDHTRADYQLKVLLALVVAVLGFLAFDSLYYLGNRFTEETSVAEHVLATLLPCAAAWIGYLFACRQGFGAALRLLLGPLSLAVFLMAVGLGLAIWVTTDFLIWSPNPDTALSWPAYVTLGPPTIVLGYVLATMIFVGLSSRILKDEDREWMSRSVAGALLFCAVWTVVCGVVLVAPKWAFDWRAWSGEAIAAAGALSAWASAFGSALAARKAGPATQPPKGWALAGVAIRAAPAVFIVALAIGLSVATNILLTSAHRIPGLGELPWASVLAPDQTPVLWHDHYGVLSRTSPVLVAGFMVALLALSWVMARYININTFSLHGMYRDRLVRAYLGASNSRRSAHKFTGFARNDDVAMHTLDPALKPFHVVNLTLNLVAANRLAWQQRKAQTFTVTPLHCGNFELGYRPSRRYGGPDGISLGTAVAISGAAASPNMGYRSTPAVGFIMTLLNARLGAWLGSPGSAGARTWTHAGPRSAISSLVKEALGLTTNRNEYVYLSDGGHFENLGLYEMVLRRCRNIVVLDSGCDPDFSFEDLGNALRKIRIDLRIPIEFDERSMQSVRERRKRCALARICYSASDEGGRDGWLLYVKPMRQGNEPPDVYQYGLANPDFPHQSTNDQWFDESQTESYRMLGLTTIEQICAGWQGGSLEELQRHVQAAYLGIDVAPAATPAQVRTLAPAPPKAAY